MKKIILALTLLTAAVFASCSNDDTPTDALTGTTWASSYEGIPLELHFQKGGKATLNMGSERYVGTYTYNQPNVTIQMPIEGQNETFNGTYSNGALHISNSEYGSFIFTQTGGPSPDDNSGDSDGPSLGHTGKLVKKITVTYDEEDEVEIYTIEYDGQNRPIRAHQMYQYQGKIEEESTITATYNGNTVTIVDSSHSRHNFTATLNDAGYIVSEILTWKDEPDDSEKCTLTYSNGVLQSFHIDEEWYESGKTYTDKKNVTYTWTDGNLTAASESYEDDNEEHIHTFIYDTSIELTPTNLDLGYLLGAYPEPTGHDEYMLGVVGFYGTASKNPLIKNVCHDDEEPYTDSYLYEYNADGTVASVYYDDEYDAIKYEFEYYE